jgi:hypothetical protein
MTMICYQPKRFSASSLEAIERANDIVEEYRKQGLDLTLRQVYYQFVSRGWIPNNQQEYKRLGSILNDARMAGKLSWESIEDRTRNLRGNSHWDDPAQILRAVAQQYREDLWWTQDHYVEVWIEKDALVGVLEAVCPENDVPYFSCRGYTSQSEMWAAAVRINRACRGGRKPVIIHLGDHDPSGVDMSRDISDRLNLFSGAKFKEPPQFDLRWKPVDIDVRRIALTMDQVQEYSPPPNPAKMTDARAKGYVDQFGDESWELDALEPRKLIDLIQAEIDSCRNQEAWDAAVEKQEDGRRRLRSAAKRMDAPELMVTLNEMMRDARRDRKEAKKDSVAWGNADGRIEAVKAVQDVEKQFAVDEEADEE